MSRTPRRAPSNSSWTPFFLKHRNLMAAEAVLVVGLLKGLMETWVKSANLPNYGKVLFIMAGTLGLLVGLYWLIESLTSAGVKKTHALLKTFSLPQLFVHALVFAALFFVYAVQHHLPVW
jgi:hypothetical protein